MTTKQTLSRRQFLVLTGTVSTAALVAACAPASAPGGAAGEDAAAGEATTNLIAWFTDRLTINQMTENEAIPDFESKNPGVQVEMQFVPESELQQKLLTAKAAGNAPDVSSIDETFLDTLQKEEVLLLGWGVKMPIPIKSRRYDDTFYADMKAVSATPSGLDGLSDDQLNDALFG